VDNKRQPICALFEERRQKRICDCKALSLANLLLRAELIGFQFERAANSGDSNSLCWDKAPQLFISRTSKALLRQLHGAVLNPLYELLRDGRLPKKGHRTTRLVKCFEALLHGYLAQCDVRLFV